MLRVRQLTSLLVSLLSAPVWAATYQFDPGRTFPQFEIDHFLIFTQRGRFTRTLGTLEYDAEQRSGRLDVTIEAGSLDTGNDERDADLRGPHWFDVNRYPTITFHSNRFIFVEDRLVAIDGELTMRGVARPMRLTIKRIECGRDPASRKWSCGADASGTLQRSRFGMLTGQPLIGDEVTLRIQAEAYLEK